MVEIARSDQLQSSPHEVVAGGLDDDEAVLGEMVRERVGARTAIAVACCIVEGASLIASARSASEVCAGIVLFLSRNFPLGAASDHVSSRIWE